MEIDIIYFCIISIHTFRSDHHQLGSYEFTKNLLSRAHLLAILIYGYVFNWLKEFIRVFRDFKIMLI